MGHVVFIPGLGCTKELFAHQLEAVSATHQVCVADHRSGATMDEIARQILAAAPEQFAVVGLSMGGMLAFEMLLQEPERITQAALLNTTARAELPERKPMRAMIMDTARTLGMAGVYEATYPFWVHTSRVQDVQLQATVRTMLNDTGVTDFVRQCEALLERPDRRADLPAIDCPALVLTGDGDMTTPPKLAEEIARLMPNAQVETIEQCGHVSTIERPEVVSKHLIDFLADT